MKHLLIIVVLTVFGSIVVPLERSDPTDSKPHITLKQVTVLQLETKALANPVAVAETVNIPIQVAPVAQVVASGGNVEQIVRQAARKYGLDEEHFLSIARCESGLSSTVVNHGYNENGNPSGLFQHLSGYYPARASKYGYSTDVFDAYSNANTTAAMFADGQSGLWECR